MRSKWLAAGVAALAFAAENPVAWTATAPQRSVPVAATFQVKLTADIQPGWHLYALDQPPGGPNRTEIWIAEDQPFEAAGEVKAPKPHVIYDQNFSMQVGLYTGKAGFEIPVKVAAGAAPGLHALTINARYQSCNDRLCLPPRTVTAQAQVNVRGPR